VVVRRITPPTVVVRGAEVGGRHGDCGSGEAPLRVGSSVAGDLKARTAGLASLKESCAQGRGVDSEAGMKGVVVAAGPSWICEHMIRLRCW